MSVQTFLDGRVTLHAGDCLAVLPSLAENSVDSVCCDPPYHLHSIVKRFAKTGRTESTRTKSGPHQRTATGFMGRTWDGGDVAFQIETWAEVLRVLKPGGYLLAFSSTRTFGRMSVAIEDAGFITHPFIAYIFGSGFPKAHNAARAIDRELGFDGEQVAAGSPVRRIRPGADQNKDGSWEKLEDRAYQPGSYVPASPEALEWDGWRYGGQALKPAIEPIYMGQKPFSEHNGAANILKHGVGAINIDGCRVPTDEIAEIGSPSWGGPMKRSSAVPGQEGKLVPRTPPSNFGRWPANVILSDDQEVFDAFPDAPGQLADISLDAPSNKTANVYGKMNRHGEKSADARYHDRGATNFAALPGMRRGDSGSAARFFYTSKADQDDRIGSKHPTVKPLDLMQYLVRLVTPPKGTILDPFAGTGTTAEAAWREGFNAVLIEREAEYLADIERRMSLCLAGPDERARESIKARLKGKPEDHGPLFDEAAA